MNKSLSYLAIVVPLSLITIACNIAPIQQTTTAEALTTSENSFTGIVPIAPDVITGQLSNGMHYLIRKNDKPEKRAEIRLVVNAGSVLEDEKQLGFAHFAEHMAFNGTEDFKKQEIIEYVESIGMKFGAHLNAHTSFDETVYINLKFGTFNISKEIYTCECPMCNKTTHPATNMGYFKTFITVEGKRKYED